MRSKTHLLMTSVLPNETPSIITAVVFFSLLVLTHYDVIHLDSQPSVSHRIHQTGQNSMGYTQPRTDHPALSQSTRWSSKTEHSRAITHKSSQKISFHRQRRYVSKPDVLSAQVRIARQDHPSLTCQAMILHPRVALTVHTCARVLSDDDWYLYGRAGRSTHLTESGRSVRVVKSIVHTQSRLALHILSHPLAVAPVYLSDPQSLEDKVNLAFDDETKLDRISDWKTHPIKHAIYGSFVVSRSHPNSALQLLSALYVEQQIKVLSTSDRIWVQTHLQQLSLH